MKDTPKDLARKHLRALLVQIERHNRLYYQENAPEISDFEYDCLQAEVKSIYQRFPELEHAEGPGSDLQGNAFAQVPHWSPMLSLANTYSKEEFFDFDAKLREKIVGKVAYVLEPKVDGMAINLLYKNGTLFKALTRGDGKIGEDVTENIKTIKAIPLVLPDKTYEEIEIRGEVYISNTDFDAINAEQELLGLETFSNARWEARIGDSHGTYNAFKNYTTTTKIDHIFYRGFSGCRRFTTVRQKWAGYQFISDHFPVYAVLKLQ